VGDKVPAQRKSFLAVDGKDKKGKDEREEKMVEKPIRVHRAKPLPVHQAKPVQVAKPLEERREKPIHVHQAKPLRVHQAKPIHVNRGDDE
jgi:hypothetical protein